MDFSFGAFASSKSSVAAPFERLFGLPFVLGLSAVLVVPAAASGDASTAVRRFGSWELVCETRGREDCKVVQVIGAPESRSAAFALTVVPEGDRNLVGIASVPLGTYIAPGIQFSIDGRKAYKLLVETCNASGCHAGFPISPELLKELRNGKEARFRIWSTKANSNEIAAPLSGFSAALDGLRPRP